VLDTRGPDFSYHPDKLSMERMENAAFGPVDRIGQLTMRNLDIADSRAKLEQYARLAGGQLGSSALFGELEAVVAPDAILASNTSSIRIASIARALKHRDRVCGMHYFNPVPLMKT